MAYDRPNWEHKRCKCGGIIRHAGDVVKPEHVCRDCNDTLCERCCDREKELKKLRFQRDKLQAELKTDPVLSVTATPAGWKTDDGLTFKPYKQVTFCGKPVYWKPHLDDCCGLEPWTETIIPVPAADEKERAFFDFMRAYREKMMADLVVQFEGQVWDLPPNERSGILRKLSWRVRFRLWRGRVVRGLLRALAKRFSWVKDPDDAYDYF